MPKDLQTQALTVLHRRTIGVLEYARTVELPDGDFSGTLYDPARHQAQDCTLRALDAGAGWCAILKPVQDGGSLASFVPILRRAHALGQTCIIAYPTMDAAKDAWVKKVWPMLERQGGVQPKSGGGSRGGAARVVNLPSGGSLILRAAGGRQESGQASVTADAMLVDEVDDWADLRVLRLIERRLSRSRDPLIIYISTCKRDADDGVERSRIVRLYEQGTMTRLHYPCPSCGALFPFEWELVNVDQSKIACPHCGELHDDGQRVAMLKKWKRVDGAVTHKFSIMWSALESPFAMLIDGRKLPVLQALCIEYLAAKESAERNNDHGLLRQFFRDRLCRPYRDDQNIDDKGQTLIPTRNRLSALSAASVIAIDIDRKEQDGDSVHLAHVPAWCEHCTVGVDVQRGGDRAPGRLYFGIIGRGGGRGAIIGYGSIILAPAGRTPSTAELHAGLDRMDGLLRDWAPSAPIVARGVDVGDRQDEIRAWLKSHPDWWAIKGTGPLKAALGDFAGWMYRRAQNGNWVLRLIETEAATRAVQGEILAGKDVGSLILPRGLERQSALILHICATVEYEPGKWSASPKDRARHPEWQTRHDYLDCLAYARALAYGWERKKPAPVDDAPAPAPASSWVGDVTGSYGSDGGSWING